MHPKKMNKHIVLRYERTNVDGDFYDGVKTSIVRELDDDNAERKKCTRNDYLHRKMRKIAKRNAAELGCKLRCEPTKMGLYVTYKSYGYDIIECRGFRGMNGEFSEVPAKTPVDDHTPCVYSTKEWKDHKCNCNFGILYRPIKHVLQKVRIVPIEIERRHYGYHGTRDIINGFYNPAEWKTVPREDAKFAVRRLGRSCVEDTEKTHHWKYPREIPSHTFAYTDNFDEARKILMHVVAENHVLHEKYTSDPVDRIDYSMGHSKYLRNIRGIPNEFMLVGTHFSSHSWNNYGCQHWVLFIDDLSKDFTPPAIISHDQCCVNRHLPIKNLREN